MTIRSIKIRGSKKVLIVAPYSALYGWRLELDAEGESTSGFLELYGSRQERLQLLQTGYADNKWFLFNCQGHRILSELADYSFDTIVLDESTFIKAPYSRKKGCAVTRFYCENFRDVSHRYILTGTPAPESELDYYCQLKFLDWVNWREKNYWEFRNANFGIINFTAYISPSGSKYLAGVLAKKCFFLSRSDVKLGGKKIYEKRFVQLTDKVRKIYEKVEKEFVLEYLQQEQETIYATTKYIWMRRLCGGFVDLEFVSYAKIKELELILTTELKGEQVIIIAKHINEVKQIARYFSNNFKVGVVYGGISKLKRPEIYESFQKGNLDLLVAEPVSIRHGVNLSASDTIIFYTSPDGGETRSQVEDRIIDTATNDASLIIDLVCENTIEEDVIKNLSRKNSQQEFMKLIVQRLQSKYNLI